MRTFSLGAKAVAISTGVAACCGCATSHLNETAARPAMIKSIEFLPEMWGGAAAKAHVLSQDGALPTPVPGGTLWTFGDTFLGEKGNAGKPEFNGALSNSMAFVPKSTKGWPPKVEYLAGADGKAISQLSLLSDEDPKTRRLWPLTGVWLESAGEDHRGRAYMFYGLIEVTGEGPWGFRGDGTGLARAEKPFGPYERLNPQRGGWPIDASSLVRRDGYLYLYAPRRFKGEKDPSSDC